MPTKKAITWATAIMLAGGTLAWQIHHHQRTPAHAKHPHGSGAQSKTALDTEPPPTAGPATKATLLSQASKQHLAEQAFIRAVRSVFLRRSKEPATGETKASLEKLAAIATADLPENEKAAWQTMLNVWQQPRPPGNTPDQELQERMSQAAGTLNAMLKAHGDGDIEF